MLKQLNNNEKGFALFATLVIVILMMVLTILIISMNVSQVMFEEREVAEIQAEILALGAISERFANQLTDSPGDNRTWTETVDGKNYTIDAVMLPQGLPGYNTKTLVVNVTF